MLLNVKTCTAQRMLAAKTAILVMARGSSVAAVMAVLSACGAISAQPSDAAPAGSTAPSTVKPQTQCSADLRCAP
jgi:hypothetical protein